MLDHDSEDVRQQAAQVERRHPVAEHVRACMLGAAADFRVAVAHVEFLLTVDPDNDANLDRWWREVGVRRDALNNVAGFYRQVRDVQGAA